MPEYNNKMSGSIGSFESISQTSPPPRKLPRLVPINRVSPMVLPLVEKFGSKINIRDHEGFEVSWENLSYMVEDRPLIPLFRSRSKIRVILKCLSGSFRSGEITAVMGPSGAGKSTLLSCICGKKTVGVSGDVKISGSDKIKVSVISQDDYLLDKFTVCESMQYACKLKKRSNQVDQEIIDEVVEKLDLKTCLNTRVGQCSGGQRKRISIALELVSKPNILILDEPTSGLDSASCYSLVKTLNDLVHQEEPMAIVATIHQPSARVFNFFDQIYVISYTGQCIYYGPPGNLPQRLSLVGLGCPEYNNPADFIAEVASGEYGIESISRLANQQLNNKTEKNKTYSKSYSLSESSQTHVPQLSLIHIKLLISRSLQMVPREPYLSYLRFSNALINALFLILLFGNEPAKVLGCPPRMSYLYENKVEKLFSDFEEDEKRIRENLGCIFFVCSFTLFASMMPTVLVFPREFKVFRKEYVNGWYSPLSYFISKVISDLPITLVAVIVYVSFWYHFSGQVQELWRFSMFLLVCFLVAIIGQGQGTILSVTFAHNPVQAATFGPVLNMPLLPFVGFFIRNETMPWFFRAFAYLSHIKLEFESMVISLYGFNRCYYNKPNGTQKQPPWLRFFKLMNVQKVNEEEYEYDYDADIETEEDVMKNLLGLFSGRFDSENYSEFSSLILNHFGYTDSMIYLNIILLSIYAAVIKVASYYILAWKVRKY